MGLLGDIFSYGDGLKRKARGLLTDPMGTLSLGATRFGEDQNKLFSLMADSGYLPGDKSVLNTNKASSREQLAKQATEAYGGLLGATVWHGSPHKFDRFDSGKIGTGEGAQAYGHGIYTAQDRGIADVYRRKLTGVDGAPVANPDQSIQLKIGNLQNQIRQLEKSGDAAAPSMIKAYQNRIAELDGVGYLYKIDLPDEHIAKMLDWDKPLSQQSPGVREALSKLAPGKKYEVIEREPYFKDARYMVSPKGGNGSGVAFYATREEAQKHVAEIADEAGKNIYSRLGKDAHSAMRAQGITGIRYRDGGSRGAGGGTSNYVVFPGNEKMLSILERNGQKVTNGR